MFLQLLQIVKENKGPLEITQLCKQLNADRSTVEGMLLTLQNMGQLKNEPIRQSGYQMESPCNACAANKSKSCTSCH